MLGVSVCLVRFFVCSVDKEEFLVEMEWEAEFFLIHHTTTLRQQV